MLPYKVTKKYLKGPEQEAAKFDTEANAAAFIKSKLLEDRSMRVEASYGLYDMGELIRTFNQGDLKSDDVEEGHQSSGGRSTSQSPSPLRTAPKPTGMPDSAFKRLDDIDRDDEK